MNQSQFEANACNRRQARENACERGTIGFGFAFNWLIKWRNSGSEVKQKRITLENELKTALSLKNSRQAQGFCRLIVSRNVRVETLC